MNLQTNQCKKVICVFGSNGQLGKAIKKSLGSDFETHFIDRQICDLSDITSIESLLLNIKPEIIINAAAHTAVDKAETDQTQAYLVNTLASLTMAQFIAIHGEGGVFSLF